MQIGDANSTIADYCRNLARKEIIVNRDYQRNDKVWPDPARSFLIETILLNYPIPKFYLNQKVDAKSRTAYKEIVDGQQRSTTIKAFFDDKLTISNRSEISEIAGRTYTELETELQERFLNYSLSIDLLIAATPQEVRDVFRRMNSYTVPLNYEEQRHAQYQGAFKWFVNKLLGVLSETTIRLGTFNSRNLIRMADAKLYSEIVHALVNGIETTRKSSLDDLYEQFDASFPDADRFSAWLMEAFDLLTSWEELHKTPVVTRGYSVYSLILAIIHTMHGVETLDNVFHRVSSMADRNTVLSNLSLLSSALEGSEATRRDLKEFIDASANRTVVKSQRETRFRWYCRALTGQM